MSSKTNAERAARAAQLAQRPARAATPPPPSTEVEEPAPRTAPRVKPVRITTDLDPQAYRALTTYCTQLADRMAVPKVPHAEVMRALLAELQENDALQSQVFTRVAERRSK